MAALILDEKWLVSLVKICFWLVQYATGYNPGLVAPRTADFFADVLIWTAAEVIPLPTEPTTVPWTLKKKLTNQVSAKSALITS